MEVYNQGNRYDDDWLLWDEINKVRAPNDLVWGYSNDDYHRKSHSFRNYQHMLMDDRTEENLKAAMKYGASYFSYEPQGANETLSTYGTAITPKISEISIEEMNITITGTEYDNITWYDENTEDVWQMEEINVSKFESNFVRAVLENEHGKTLSQPFGYNADKIFNPYENVDWEVTNHFKANFHTHTTESDGDQTPEEVITKYINANYDILAITDHNKNSWSWTNWINSEPVSPSSTSAYYQGFEILAVSGNEPSNSHHFVSLFSDYSGHAIDLGFLFSEYVI